MGGSDQNPAGLCLFKTGSHKGFLFFWAREFALKTTPTILVGVSSSSWSRNSPYMTRTWLRRMPRIRVVLSIDAPVSAGIRTA